jgi:glycosyltransferase involved in cell wall biosynthesis
LARVLNKLLKNPSKIRNMGKNSRRAVEKKYNWDTEMRKLMSAYKKVYDTQTKNI